MSLRDDIVKAVPEFDLIENKELPPLLPTPPAEPPACSTAGCLCWPDAA